MSRAKILAFLLEVLGPPGPFEEPDTRDRVEEELARSAGPEVVDTLLDLVIHPPPTAELGRITPEAFESEVSRVLSMIGQRDPQDFLARVGPLIDHPSARPTLIEVIGALGSPQGLTWVASLVELDDLSEDEATRLACAFGEIDSPDARPLLDRLRAQTSADRPRVLDEIEIASEALRRRGR